MYDPDKDYGAYVSDVSYLLGFDDLADVVSPTENRRDIVYVCRPVGKSYMI